MSTTAITICPIPASPYSHQVLLIPERQNPILMDRIIYCEDGYFRRIHGEQSGSLPYPGEAAAMRSEIAALQSEVAELKAKTLDYGPARKPELVMREVPVAADVARAASDHVAAEPVPSLSDDEMKQAPRPAEQDALDRMARFTEKLEGSAPADRKKEPYRPGAV